MPTVSCTGQPVFRLPSLRLFRTTDFFKQMNSNLYNTNVEKSIIGAMLYDPNRVISILIEDGCCDKWFTLSSTKLAWKCIDTLYEDRQAIDVQTVSALAKQRKSPTDYQGFLLACIDACPTPIHARHYGRILHQFMRKRQLSKTLKNTEHNLDTERNVDDIISMLQSEIIEITMNESLDNPEEIYKTIKSQHSPDA